MSRQVSLKWLATMLSPQQAVLRANTFFNVQRACIAWMGSAVLPCLLGGPLSASQSFLAVS